MKNSHLDLNNIESLLISSSEKMSDVFERINKHSHIDVTVLIRGEKGTGKELAARTIHRASPRKHEKFIPINCASIPSHLLEIELFGYERSLNDSIESKMGLLQVVDKGVLFLDEISGLHMGLQNKLLNVLQNKKFLPISGRKEIPFHARIIATTGCNLEEMVEKKIFRKDLLYHLNILPVFMLPLQERIDDLEDLIKSILKKSIFSHRIKGIRPDALEILKSYKWPGNISELKNVIEKTIMTESSDFITLKSIPYNIRIEALHYVNINWHENYTGPLDFDVFKAESEKNFIINALKKSHGRINRTVNQANIAKNTLIRKIKKYNIDVKQYS